MKKEKTDRRIPFSEFEPGCVAMRRMPETGPGNKKKMRVATCGEARGAAIGVGARARGGGGVSEIADHPAEPGVGGAVFRVEIRGRHTAGGDERAAGGWISDARKGMAGGGKWRTQIHLMR